jgi:3-oxoacyl-[acyl-carrier protein] reductase
MSEVNGAVRIALVTGASRGIGAAIALELAARGYRVIGTATTDAGAERASAPRWPRTRLPGRRARRQRCGGGRSLIDAIVKEHGGAARAGQQRRHHARQLAMRMKDDDWDAVLDTNLKAVFRMSRAVMRPMMKQRQGRIINITSVVGASGNPGQANYAAAKAGVAGMTRALARELGSRGITVNCVAPGFIATDMTAALGDEQQKALTGQIPLGRLGAPADIAAAVAYLAFPRPAT